MPDQNVAAWENHKRPATARQGADFKYRELSRCNLRGLDFQGADLRFANLEGADLRGADLFGARLEGANLRGCRLEMTRIVEIWIPTNLPLDIANQIRAFDFGQVMTRFVGPNRDSQQLSCPYQNSSLRPLLYEWGSKSWRGGSDWFPPSSLWTLEEIIASVLDHLGCKNDLRRPFAPVANRSSQVNA